MLHSKQKEPMPWNGETGFVQQIWQKKSIQKSWNMDITPDNTRIFLCGHPEMIREMINLLAKSGFKEHSSLEPGTIHLEKYW